MGTDDIRALLEILGRLAKAQERQAIAQEAIAEAMLEEVDEDEGDDEDDPDFG